MKFGKLLKGWAAEDMPESADLVLRFKDLKRQLKLIRPAEEGDQPVGEERVALAAPSPVNGAQDGAAGEMLPRLSTEESIFVQTLREDLGKFNDFFMDKEEDFIIKSRVLEDRMKGSTNPEETTKLRKAFADLHGSMILLLHWSLLNFTAVVKILKKHGEQSVAPYTDKHSGTLLKDPLLCSVLKQPFNSTDRIKELVKIAEERSEELSARTKDLADGQGGSADMSPHLLAGMRENEAELNRRTRSALEVWEEMQATAVTPSTVLPALKKRKRDGDNSSEKAK